MTFARRALAAAGLKCQISSTRWHRPSQSPLAAGASRMISLPGLLRLISTLSKRTMLKALGFLCLSVFLLHFWLLARTGFAEPCAAAFAKLEYEAIGDYKTKRRDLSVSDEEQEQYRYINERNLFQCYKIALF